MMENNRHTRKWGGAETRGGLAVKGACCSYRGFKFSSHHPLEVAVTPTSGDLMAIFWFL